MCELGAETSLKNNWKKQRIMHELGTEKGSDST